MSDFKCRMCGAELHVDENTRIAECEYCGSKMALPIVIGGSPIASYFSRADERRRASDFDKAVELYDQIITADPENAEAHWGAVISRYGIDYVKDPSTGKMVPTCNRLQNVSILQDPDYTAAIEYAPDSEVRALYEEQGKEIAAIQKRILEISEKEKPYDVFISYKEKDDAGNRTPDSLLAQEIYYSLTDSGYRVFFSRITLESKLGEEYEPYIFAALQSAKVMLVVGTKPEYFNAVWVRNEWSRYLTLLSKDRSRKLFPCYKDMDPYNLPQELSLYQAQDLGKIGCIEDIKRGIEKVIKKDKEKQVSAASASYMPLLQRADMLLSVNNFEEADTYYTKTLEVKPDLFEAYLGRILCKYRLHNLDELKSRLIIDSSDDNFLLAMKTAPADKIPDLEMIRKYSDKAWSIIREAVNKNTGNAMSYLISQEENKRDVKGLEKRTDDFCKGTVAAAGSPTYDTDTIGTASNAYAIFVHSYMLSKAAELKEDLPDSSYVSEIVKATESSLWYEFFNSTEYASDFNSMVDSSLRRYADRCSSLVEDTKNKRAASRESGCFAVGAIIILGVCVYVLWWLGDCLGLC